MEHPFQYFALAGMRDIKQYSCVDYYYSNFEFLRALCLNRFPVICDAYFLSQFILGLKKEIQVYVLQHHPVHLLDAYELACISEYYCAHPTTSVCIENSTHSLTVDISVSSFHLTQITEPIVSYVEVPLCSAISSKLQDDVDEISHDTKDISSNGESDLLNSKTSIVLLSVPCKEMCSLSPSTIGFMIAKVIGKGDDTNYVPHEPAAICSIKVDGHATILDKGDTDSISLLTSPCILSQPIVYLCEEKNVTSCLHTQCLLSLQVHSGYGISLVLSTAIPIGTTSILSFKVASLYKGPPGAAATLRDNGGLEQSLGGLPLSFLEWCRASSAKDLAIIFCSIQGYFNASHDDDDVTATQGTASSSVINALLSTHVACSPVGCTDMFWPIDVDSKSDWVIQRTFYGLSVLVPYLLSMETRDTVYVQAIIDVVEKKWSSDFVAAIDCAPAVRVPNFLSVDCSFPRSSLSAIISDVHNGSTHLVLDMLTPVSILEHANTISEWVLWKLPVANSMVIVPTILSKFLFALQQFIECARLGVQLVGDAAWVVRMPPLSHDTQVPSVNRILYNIVCVPSDKSWIHMGVDACSTIHMDNEIVNEYFYRHVHLRGIQAANRYLIILGTTVSVKDGKHRSVCKHPPLLVKDLSGAIKEELVPLWIVTAEVVFLTAQHHAIIATLHVSLGGVLWYHVVARVLLAPSVSENYPLVRCNDGLLGALATNLQPFFSIYYTPI